MFGAYDFLNFDFLGYFSLNFDIFDFYFNLDTYFVLNHALKDLKYLLRARYAQGNLY